MPQQLRDLVARAPVGRPGRCRGSPENSRGRAVAAAPRLSGRKALLFEGGSLSRSGLCGRICVSIM